MTTPGKIYAQMIKVMAEVDPISKDRANQSQGYKFRGIDDVYAALQAILAKHGVFTLPTVLEDRTEERQTNKGGTLIYRVLRISYRFYADDGSYVDAVVIGEGMDSGDKASNKAMSVAHKYCLLQAFCIPTIEPKDPENDSHQVKSKQHSGPEVYKATDVQKRMVRTAMESAGFKNQNDWVAFSEQFINCEMGALDAAIKEYKSNTSN